jgi:hypothetical protein
VSTQDAGAAAVERRLFEVLGGWVPTVYDAEAKLLLRVHSFQHAWHADLFTGLGRSVGPAAWEGGVAGARLAALAAAVDAMAALHRTSDRLVAVYRVGLPHLVATYGAVAAAASPADGPLGRVLNLVLADDEAARREGERVVQRLADASGVDDPQAADKVPARIEQLLLREATAGSRMV